MPSDPLYGGMITTPYSALLNKLLPGDFADSYGETTR